MASQMSSQVQEASTRDKDLFILTHEEETTLLDVASKSRCRSLIWRDCLPHPVASENAPQHAYLKVHSAVAHAFALASRLVGRQVLTGDVAQRMDFVLGPVKNGRRKAKRKNGDVKPGW
jgi:hypothetical protein